MVDGSGVGSPAGNDRDGTDFNFNLVGTQTSIQANDVEVSESWYPIRFDYRRRSCDPSGAGQYRGGRGVDLAFAVYGSPELTGASIGGHGNVPMPGPAGGAPGRGARIELRDPEGGVASIGTNTQGFSLPEGHSYVVRAAGGGGWGDPLDRDVAAVLEDVAAGLISAVEAREVYGVDVTDGTTSHRTALLRDRLAKARPAVTEPRPVDAEVLESAQALPLTPGVEQRGGVAVSARSGAVLAHAPAHWSDGCPVLVAAVADGVETRSYLDPATGHILHTEVATAGEPRSFESCPKRWSTWRAG
jgi:N-methylhydantoinase B